MSNGEIVLASIAFIGLVLGILKVWIQSQTDIAQIKAKQSYIENELKQHKQDDNLRYEQMRTENREDHQIMFRKIDKFLELK